MKCPETNLENRRREERRGEERGGEEKTINITHEIHLNARMLTAT